MVQINNHQGLKEGNKLGDEVALYAQSILFPDGMDSGKVQQGDVNQGSLNQGGGSGDTGKEVSVSQQGGDTTTQTTTQTQNYLGGYNQASWGSIYRDYIDRSLGATSPGAYQWASQQGLSGDALQRTAFTQFLLQGTEDDIWSGDITGGYAQEDITGETVARGEVFKLYDDPSENPYANFLQSYRPVMDDKLTNSIGDVINVMNTFEVVHESGTEYSDEELRNFRWRERFLYGSNADQNQEALAALPIIQSSPGVLRQETSNILKRLHDRWIADPNRNAKQSWLEFVHQNNYFGMIPKEQQQQTTTNVAFED